MVPGHFRELNTYPGLEVIQMDRIRWDGDARYEKIITDISDERLFEHVKRIADFKREAGSEGERAALAYIKGVLEDYGIETKLLEFDSYIGLPETGELTFPSSAEGPVSGRPPAFSPQTPEEGLEADVVYAGRGRAEELAHAGVKDKIALVDGLASPHLARAVEDYGALGLVCISGEQIHDMIMTSIWGTPTPETAWRIPRCHALTIVKTDGDRIKEWLRQGPLRARMNVRSFVGWKKIPILLADVKGRAEPERYVILSGHIDSWHYGATDNGTANAAMIEIARALNLHKEGMRRGLRLAFWSGHSHGRYSGSAWYADTFWEELYRNCVGLVTMDIVGCKGSTNYTEFPRLALTKACGARAVREITGQEGQGVPFGRAGDQSFFGIGIPSLFGVMSRPALEQSELAASLKILLGHAGFPWWWHTVHDTIDKVDLEVMKKDTQVAALAICYFCRNSILPLDCVEAAQEILDLLTELEQKAGTVSFLADTVAKARDLTRRAEDFSDLILNKALEDDTQIEYVNTILINLGRILIPVVQTAIGPFDHDLALPIKRLQSLQPVLDLAAMDPEKDAARFLSTRLIRERNRVEHALMRAKDLLNTAARRVLEF